MRAAAKRVLEGLLLRSGAARLSRAAHRGRALVLAYHNIVPDDAALRCGEPGLHLTRSAFAAQLDLLVETHELVRLEKVLDPVPAAVDRPRAAITFDDAYRGALTLGLEELRKRNLPAVVFVAPGLLGGKTFWWDAIPDVPRDWALDELRGQEGEVRRRAGERGYRQVELPDYCETAEERELGRALRSGLISLGSHSWSHPNLANLTTSELRTELLRPLEWLRERSDTFTPWLAYPYGSYSPQVAEAAAAAGYSAALRIEGGWLPKQIDDRYTLPRLNIPAGLSLNGFALRIAGLFCRS